MSRFGGYAGLRRAQKALAGPGIPVDDPAAGYLQEGEHIVKLVRLVEAPNFTDLFYEGVDGSAGAHRDRVYDDNERYLTTLWEGCGERWPRVGDKLHILLGWPEGRYRIYRNTLGYFAIRDGMALHEPVGTIAQVEALARAQHVGRAYLQVVQLELMSYAGY